MNSLSFYLRPSPPFRLDLTVWALRRMPHNTVDLWDGRTYTRALVVGDAVIRVSLRQTAERSIVVEAAPDKSVPNMKQLLLPMIERLSGIRRDMTPFYEFAARTPEVEALARDFRGFRPPRFPSMFEAVINAISCQQISLHVCIVLLDRIARTWGKPWSGPGQPLHAFPRAQELAAATVPQLRSLGYSSAKARAIVALSQEVASNRLDLDGLERKTDDEVMQALTALPGIGPWSAQYVMLRGLGRTHIFPGQDSGALRTMQLLLKMKERPDTARVSELTSRWHPFAGLIYFHFLLNKLRSRGFLQPEPFARPVSSML